MSLALGDDSIGSVAAAYGNATDLFYWNCRCSTEPCFKPPYRRQQIEPNKGQHKDKLTDGRAWVSPVTGSVARRYQCSLLGLVNVGAML